MPDIEKLKQIAKEIRREICKMTTAAGSGHPGGSLSATDVVVALYFYKLKHNPKNPEWPERDRFVLSKGHCSPLLYAVLAKAGYFPQEELKTFRKIGSKLQGHPNRLDLSGVEASTGTLGQGLSIGNGIAFAGRLDGRDYKVYVLMGDGELQEGMVWEAAMTAGHYKLENVIAIVDYNHLQIDGTVEKVKDVAPLKEKFKAFNWKVIEVDGHNFEAIIRALDNASESRGKPTVIIAKTTKGKGVSFMENACDFHGKALTEEELAKALGELK